MHRFSIPNTTATMDACLSSSVLRFGCIGFGIFSPITGAFYAQSVNFTSFPNRENLPETKSRGNCYVIINRFVNFRKHLPINHMKHTFYSALAAAVVLMGSGDAAAQLNRAPRKASLTKEKATRTVHREQTGEYMGIPFLTPNPTVANEQGLAPRAIGPAELIGQTLYDLQSNSSVPTRILNHGDGTLSTTWTFSAEAGTPWSDRGMAYHYFDGTNWVKNPDYQNVNSIARVEPARTGFGSIGRVAGVGDIIVAHQTAVTSTQISRNISLDATENWVSDQNTTMELVWPRMAVGGPDGKTVHVIGVTEPSGGTFTGTPYNGINGALLYNRSIDGGQSFDETMIQLPGMDSTIFGGVGGDSYAIDAKQNTVAFVVGDLTTRLMVFKSLDNGVTWDTMTVLTFPYEPWDDQAITDLDGDGDADSVETFPGSGVFVNEGIFVSDGANAILIDNNDKVHVWFGAMVMANDDTTDDGAYSYYPGTSGMYYWNEDFGVDSVMQVADLVDDDEDGQLDIVVSYVSGSTRITPYGSGLTTFPSAGIGADGTLYMTYSGSKEGVDYQLAGPSYKHIYAVKSTDGGATWTAPTDVITESTGLDVIGEYAYCSIARNVDENAHLVFQFDYFPGSAVTIDNGAVHPFGDPSNIYYLPVGIADIGVGVKEVKSTVGMSIMPNPADQYAVLAIESGKSGMASVSVVNLLGQTVDVMANQKLTSGKQNLVLNTANLTEGIYLVTVTLGNEAQTLKLVVKH
jgi:hypothetical protein